VFYSVQVEENSYTRKHDTCSRNLYESTCANFLYKILECVLGMVYEFFLGGGD